MKQSKERGIAFPYTIEKGALESHLDYGRITYLLWVPIECFNSFYSLFPFCLFTVSVSMDILMLLLELAEWETTKHISLHQNTSYNNSLQISLIVTYSNEVLDHCCVIHKTMVGLAVSLMFKINKWHNYEGSNYLNREVPTESQKK